MKVSVVIPAYNEEKYIGKCLESVINQRESPDEVIVVNNNCTDRTIEIAEKFGARIVREKDQGMIHARNAGFDAARYEIIARIDADVVLLPDWISKIKESFKDPDLGGLSGPASYSKVPIISEITNFLAFSAFYIIGLSFGHPMMCGPNMIIRKSAWEKVKNDVCMQDKEVHEDIDLSIHLAKIAKIEVVRSFKVRTTRGRWSRLFTEYIIRLIKMLASHRFKSRSGRN